VVARLHRLATIQSHDMSSFKVFRISSDEGKISGRVVETTLDQLTPGDVVIRAAYSSVNYKDALAATGAGKIIRQFPRVGGIDVSGVVESSTDARFRAGDEVIVTGYGLGVENDGGYSELVRVPGDWIVPLPEGLTLLEAMALGTAGFTAALAVVRLEQSGVRAGRGPVAVTGSTGGVGSVAIAALSRLGYEVTAITGKDAEHEYLRSLGAVDMLSRHTIEFSGRPIESSRWAAAVDAAGGDLLSWLVKTTQPWGGVASTGLTGGIELHLTVIPFILRGVSLIGIDSVTCPMNIRLDVWRRLATDMKPPNLPSMTREIPLDGLADAFAVLASGQARGRFVVKVSG
jgi:NADPH2:quinone reductase